MPLQEEIDTGSIDLSVSEAQSGYIDSKLLGIDLNLLVALEALLICRNVTHAARRLGQTQPAVSRSLARLRDIFGDDLLVRSSGGMKLTARGDYLVKVVPAAMLHIRDVISSRRSEMEMRISISSTLAPALLPHFMNAPLRYNGSFKLSVHEAWNDGVSNLRLNTADLILGKVRDYFDDVYSEVIFTEDFVTLVASNNHSSSAFASDELFRRSKHISLIENGSETFPEIMEAFLINGIRRPSLVEVPDITAAALMVSQSDLALTVPRSVASWLNRTLPLRSVIPPLKLPRHQVSIAWRSEGLFGKTYVSLRDDVATLVRKSLSQGTSHERPLHPLPCEG